MKHDIRYHFVFLLIFILIFSSCFAVIANLDYLKQFLGIICYLFLPGYLILKSLKIQQVNIFKKLLLSIGLSLTFLIIGGIIFNQILSSINYPVPLLTSNIAFFFTSALCVMTVLAYYINKENFIFSINIDLNSKNTGFFSNPYLIIPIIFPLLAIIGSYFMNNFENNFFLILMLVSIAFYFFMVVIYPPKNMELVFPFSIFLISASILLMHGLTSNFVVGRDINNEFFAFRIVEHALEWSLANYPNSITSCLSITLLPEILENLLNLSGLFIFKIFFQILWSLTPLAAFFIFKNFFSDRDSFICAFFFIAQTAFIFQVPSAVRQEIAIFFFIVAFLVYFDKDISQKNKKILLILFITSTILSHYSTTFAFFILLLLFISVVYLLHLLHNKIPWKKEQKNSTHPSYMSTNIISLTLILLFFTLMIFWQLFITVSIFTSATEFSVRVYDLFINNLFDPQHRDFTFLGISNPILADKIVIFIFDISIVIICIGLVNVLLTRFKNQQSEFDDDYIIFMFLSIFILIVMFLLPYVTIGYSLERAFMQLLIFVAPAFLIGFRYIFNIIPKISNYYLIFTVFFLILQFFAATFLIHQLSGDPYSEDLNRIGPRPEELIVYDQDVNSAHWLGDHFDSQKIIYFDYRGQNGIFSGMDVNNVNKAKFSNTIFLLAVPINSGYIYLRHSNIVNGNIRNTESNRDYANIRKIEDYRYLFQDTGKVFDNGGSEIWEK